MALETSGSLELLSITWLFKYTVVGFQSSLDFVKIKVYVQRRIQGEIICLPSLKGHQKYVLLKKNFIRNKKKYVIHQNLN